MLSEEEMTESAAVALEESETTKEKIKHFSMSRGFSGILALGRWFRRNDKDASGSLSTEEMSIGLNQSGLNLSDEEVAELLQEFDTDGEGTVDYEEFLAGVRPELNEERLAIVEEAFASLDVSGDGVVTIEDLTAKYKECEEECESDEDKEKIEYLGKFLENIEDSTSQDGVLTKKEFIDYYSGISYSIDNDEFFVDLVKKSYKL